MSATKLDPATPPVSTDLQERLAQRIQKAAAGNYNVSSWLAVEVGAAALLVPLSHASEVFPYTTIFPISYTKPWFLGVANLRGELVGITNLREFLGQQTVHYTEQELLQAKFLTFNPVLELNAAVLVDKILGLKSVDAFVSSEPSESGQAPYLGEIYQDKTGRRWQELNIQKLAQTNEFLFIHQ